MLALALLSFGCVNVAAQEEEEDLPVLPVKMTYVSGTDAEVDIAYGVCDTIKAGWNLGNSVAVGSTITFGNKSWGANWIGILKVDASAIPGTVQKATLKAKVSGSLDSKRTTGWGVALTDNEWSEDLTYTTVGTWTVSALLNGGVQVWTTSKSATSFEEHEWDITDAFAGGESIATILVYEGIKDGNGGAAGGYMTEAEVEVEYEPFEETTTEFDFEDGVNIFTDDSRITSAIAADDVLGSNVTVFTAAGNCQNGYGFAHYDFTDLLNKPALVKVEFDYYNEAGTRSILSIGDRLVRGNDGGCTKNTYGSKGAIFRIGSDKNDAFINDVILPQADVTTTSTVTVVDEETGEASEVEVENTQIGLCNKWLHVVVMINNDAKTVAWVVNDQEGENIHYGSSAFYSADANAASQIDVFAWISSSMSGKVDNLEITNYKSNAVFADYTVKYVDAENNELKESRVGNGQVGKPVKLLDSDKAAITKDGVKYLYESDNTAEVVIEEEGTEINVVFREAKKYYIAVTLKTAEGTTLQTVRDDNLWFWEDEVYTYYPPRGIGKEGKYYFCPATVADNKGNITNGTDMVLDPNVKEPKWNSGLERYYIMDTKNDYSLVDTVAYYSDFERLALPVEDEGNGTGLGLLVGTVNNWWSFSNSYFNRFAAGRGIRLDAGSYVYTEPIAEAGTYKLTLYGRNDLSENCPNPFALGLRDAEGNVSTYTEVEIPDWGSAETNWKVVENVAIPAGSSLVIFNDGSLMPESGKVKQISLDDISIAKSGDYVEPVVVGIQNVEKAQQNGIIYNLAGQAVKAAQKGLYIKNGKKYIVK